MKAVIMGVCFVSVDKDPAASLVRSKTNTVTQRVTISLHKQITVKMAARIGLDTPLNDIITLTLNVIPPEEMLLTEHIIGPMTVLYLQSEI